MPADPTAPLFLSTWGDIQLFISAIEWESGETQIVHDLASGDVHPVQPRGSRIRTATAQLLFDDFDGAPDTGIQAFRRFEATTKERRIFTHPVSGSYFARIGEFKPTLDENSVIRATCEFIPDAPVHPVAPAGAGTTSAAGETSVAAAADVMNQKLADQGVGFQPSSVKRLDPTRPIDLSVSAAFSADVSVSLSANVSVSANASASATASAGASVQAAASASAFAFAGVYARALAFANASAVAQASGMASANAFAFAFACAALNADARSSVASWTDEDVSTRKVIIDATRISESINAMIDLGGFQDDLQLWPCFRAAILLGESIRSAVVAATSETPSVFVIRVQRQTALLALAARIYGGFEAETRARQIAGLNDIRTPGWLDIGDYLMPQVPVSQIASLLAER